MKSEVIILRIFYSSSIKNLALLYLSEEEEGGKKIPKEFCIEIFGIQTQVHLNIFP